MTDTEPMTEAPMDQKPIKEAGELKEEQSSPEQTPMSSDETPVKEAAAVIEAEYVDPRPANKTSFPLAAAAAALVSPEDKKEGDEIPKHSRREQIRARLRAQEARLSSIVRSTSGDGTSSFLGQMKEVKSSLEKVEQEKSELEKELERLKNATGDDEFLKEQMAGIQDGFDKQVEKIQSLQQELNVMHHEIESLRLELVKKLQRIVELEFDLETHEVHYTNYAQEQFKLGDEALAEIKGAGGEFDGHASASSVGSVGDLSKVTTRKAQKLISKLLTDLDNIEVRYKEEKLRTLSAMQRMELENEELRTKIEVLEQRLGENEASQGSDEDRLPPIEMHSLNMLRHRAELAEAKKAIYRKDYEKLKVEHTELKQEVIEDSKRAKHEIERLKSENEVLRERVTQLESKSGGLGLKRKKKEEKAERFAEIERRIQGNFDNLSRLENSLDIKDKQIATLKKEVTNLRLRDIAEGGAKGDSGYSSFDAELLRGGRGINKSFESDGTGATEGTENSYVAMLQKQLQEAQQQLVKKDQELVIERAKAASTAAGLLARITELTGKKADKSTKQVPLRFYL